MTYTLSDLPAWLREGVNLTPSEQQHVEARSSRFTQFRENFKSFSYPECLYLLVWEFTKRNRPRKWIVDQLTGRLNMLRNAQHANDIAHLKTWVFRA